MSDMITTLATRTGIDPETARKGLGAMLSFAKGQLPPDAFGKVQSAVPGSEEMISSFESSGESSSPGLLGTVAGLAGKLLGGQGGQGRTSSRCSHARELTPIRRWPSCPRHSR